MANLSLGVKVSVDACFVFGPAMGWTPVQGGPRLSLEGS